MERPRPAMGWRARCAAGSATGKIQAYLTAAAIANLLWTLAAVLLVRSHAPYREPAADWHQRWPDRSSSTAPPSRHDSAHPSVDQDVGARELGSGV